MTIESKFSEIANYGGGARRTIVSNLSVLTVQRAAEPQTSSTARKSSKLEHPPANPTRTFEEESVLKRCVSTSRTKQPGHRAHSLSTRLRHATGCAMP